MFSAFAAGAFLEVTGFIGWDVRSLHGFFQGGRWRDGPIFWQIALGAGLLWLGVHWFRQLGGSRRTFAPPNAGRQIKNVGHGKTAGADERQARRTLTS
jgi:hypothetical protein